MSASESVGILRKWLDATTSLTTTVYPGPRDSGEYTAELRHMLVVTHDGCNDGAMAAFLVRAAYQLSDAHVVGVQPNCSSLRDVDEWAVRMDMEMRHVTVVVLDVMLAAETMLRLVDIVSRVIIVDHHVGNEKHIVELTRRHPDKVFAIYDRSRAACGIVHDELFGPSASGDSSASPWAALVDHVQARDLFSRPDDPAVLQTYLALRMLPVLRQNDFSPTAIGAKLALVGPYLVAEYQRTLEAFVKSAHLVEWLTPSGYTPCATIFFGAADYTYVSDSLAQAAKHFETPYAIGVFVHPDAVQLCIRSSNSQQHSCLVMAQLYGGSGSPAAAGARVPRANLDLSTLVRGMPALASASASGP